MIGDLLQAVRQRTKLATMQIAKRQHSILMDFFINTPQCELMPTLYHTLQQISNYIYTKVATTNQQNIQLNNTWPQKKRHRRSTLAMSF